MHVPAAFPCCLIMLHVRAACRSEFLRFISMLHVHTAGSMFYVHTTSPCMSMLVFLCSMPLRKIRAPCPCFISTLHFHAVHMFMKQICLCCMSIYMPHILAACPYFMFMSHVLAACPCFMSMPHVLAACSCFRSMHMSTLHVHAAALEGEYF
jgi:hypothetical protein